MTRNPTREIEDLDSCGHEPEIPITDDAGEIVEWRCACGVIVWPSDRVRPRIYIASKSTHGPRWVEMRERGAPFISTWIGESGPGQTSDWRDLTRRCVEEASSADGMIVYAQPGEVLKGALIEWGAALAAGKPVVYVGPPHKWTAHPLVRTAGTVEEAVRGLTGVVLPPECPGPDCPMCNGSECRSCPAPNPDLNEKRCECDVLDRHGGVWT